MNTTVRKVDPFALIWSTGELDTDAAHLTRPERPGGMKTLAAKNLAGAKAEAFLLLRQLPVKTQRIELYQNGRLVSRSLWDPTSGKWGPWTASGPHRSDADHDRFSDGQQRVENIARAADAVKKLAAHLERNEPWPTLKKRGFLGFGGSTIDNPAHARWEKALEQAHQDHDHQAMLAAHAADRLAEKMKDFEFAKSLRIEPPTGAESPGSAGQSLDEVDALTDANLDANRAQSLSPREWQRG